MEQVSVRPLFPLVFHGRHPSPVGCTIGPLGATLPDRNSYDTDGGQERAKPLTSQSTWISDRKHECSAEIRNIALTLIVLMWRIG